MDAEIKNEVGLEEYDPSGPSPREQVRLGAIEYAELVERCHKAELAHHALNMERVALQAEVLRLREEIRLLKSETWCAYCGVRYPLDDEAATKISAHIATCDRHPMRAVEAERDALREQVDEMAKVIAADTRRMLGLDGYRHG